MPHQLSTPYQVLPTAVNPHGCWGHAEHWNVRWASWGYTEQETLFSLRSPPTPAQANFPPAVSTMEAARICVCSPTKAMSTVPVEGAGSSRRTSPVGVREQVGTGTGHAMGCQYKRPFFQSPAQATRLDPGWAETHDTFSLPSCELLLSGTR